MSEDARQQRKLAAQHTENAAEGRFGAVATSAKDLQVNKTQCTPHAVFVCARALPRLIRSDLHSTIYSRDRSLHSWLSLQAASHTIFHWPRVACGPLRGRTSTLMSKKLEAMHSGFQVLSQNMHGTHRCMVPETVRTRLHPSEGHMQCWLQPDGASQTLTLDPPSLWKGACKFAHPHQGAKQAA